MLKKLSNTLENLLGIIAIIMICAFFSFILIDRTQLTSRSFKKIALLNNQIEKLSTLENSSFPDEEELRFNINKLVDPNIFNKYFFLENYLWTYEYVTQYFPRMDNLRKLNINDGEIMNLDKEKYFNRDSLMKKIETLAKGKDYITDYEYIDSKYYRRYHLRPIHELIVSNDAILNLKKIKHTSFKSSEELEQALRQTLGLLTYKQINPLILEVADSSAEWQKIWLYSSIIIFVFLFIAFQIVSNKIKMQEKSNTENELEEDINKAKQDISDQPEKVIPVWSLAYYTLQKYYNKNLSQINSIYKLSITVMIMGFLLIISILITTIYFKIEMKLDSIGIIAGIITEFIGATFLFIYKSTINQALQHARSLEQINKVGMSIKIVESIEKDENNKSKIDEAKIEIAKELINSGIMTS